MIRKLFFSCLALSLCFLLAGPAARAQEEKALEEAEATLEDEGPSLSFGADLMSRYIWRGIDFGNSPAIQPNIYFSWKGLNIGAWGSYAFARQSIRVNDTVIVEAGNYSEMDLYLSYTYKWFTLMAFDYFTIDGMNPNQGNRYFDYNNATTGHTVEISLAFDGPESFPVQIIASTLVYGADKDQDSTGIYGLGDQNNYSTYFELGYKFRINRIGVDLRPFIGGIPFGSSWYGPYAGIINVGLTAKKEIPITEKYGLPVQVSLVTNPQAQSVFLVFGLSL